MRATKQIDNISMEMKKIRLETRQAMLLRGNMQQLNKATNKIEQQYDLCNSQLHQMEDIIDHKVVKVAK